MNLDEFYLLLAKRIKLLRKKANMTQEVLAEKVGIGLVHMSKIEIGIARPSIPVLYKIANILNVSVKDLFDFE